MRAGTTCAAAVTTTDTRFANYAFASELGSGIYEISGRTVQVYQLQPRYPLRPASPHGSRPGINLILPVTVGFFNFQPTDLIHLHVPTHIGALSFEPGVHVHYQETVLPIRDGKPKFKDVPKEMGGTGVNLPER